MPTIGLDGEIILDGTAYMVQPDSFKMRQPRIRQATIRADGSEGYVDLGPGKREWSMTILCVNDLLRSDSTPTGISGQQYRDSLRNSYISNIGSTITFIDLINGSMQVHFDHYEETIIDTKTAITSLATGGSLAASYAVTITLVET